MAIQETEWIITEVEEEEGGNCCYSHCCLSMDGKEIEGIPQKNRISFFLSRNLTSLYDISRKEHWTKDSTIVSLSFESK